MNKHCSKLNWSAVQPDNDRVLVPVFRSLLQLVVALFEEPIMKRAAAAHRNVAGILDLVWIERAESGQLSHLIWRRTTTGRVVC